MKVKVMVNGEEYEVDVEEVSRGKFRVKFGGKSYEVEAEGLGLGIGLNAITEAGQREASEIPAAPSAAPSPPQTGTAPAPKPEPERAAAAASAAQSSNVVVAPMPGKVLRVLVRVGDVVEAGQGLLI
ncbi:MAG: acetyl-CoA carboxylase biotin carboxyl carrier protein subunit, partial [Thermococci archaeon]|nr:acetyl-CoA carboxylase biotin carboxyl carrier protein subunit [Thermococci archaeon]